MAVVERERRGAVEIVRINRPEAKNAISPEVSREMAEALDAIESDPEVRAVVVTGTGDVFCAGADLKVVAQGRGNEIAAAKGGFAGLTNRDFAKPIIAAVQGPALAGGFEIVLSCDLVAAGGLLRLPKRVPLALALEFAMTGDPISAIRAFELGLVNRLVPKDRVLDEAVALAERIGENSPIAVRLSRKLVKEAAEIPEADGWKRNATYAVEVFGSGDAIEGSTAFAEKRKPNWKSV
jgi:enoyl-CoA hydratase/carnithine racemase